MGTDGFADSSTSIVMGVNSGDNIYFANQNVSSNPNWTQVPGGLSWISYSNKQSYGVNSGGNIYYSNDYTRPNWVQVPGGLVQVSFDGYNMIVMGVNSGGNIYYANQNITRNPNWTQLPGSLTNISYSNKQIYGVNSAGNIYYASDYTRGNWVQIPGGLKQVSFDAYIDPAAKAAAEAKAAADAAAAKAAAAAAAAKAAADAAAAKAKAIADAAAAEEARILNIHRIANASLVNSDLLNKNILYPQMGSLPTHPHHKPDAMNMAKTPSSSLSGSELNQPGMSVSCPSGDKPTVSFVRNTKFNGDPSKDVNTLKNVTALQTDFENRSKPTDLSCGKEPYFYVDKC